MCRCELPSERQANNLHYARPLILLRDSQASAGGAAPTQSDMHRHIYEGVEGG